ncbi:unnamed protein product [Medioppia subpectinata]|uniref:Uncharacterized protein n=1 Tax=Medioppia subpectinata TaxID=1979941 RepID=A0A7R9L6L4_9ACAR|nr:unnamed protein product [Medioppia subpectinata]CAG2116313.1 unnamed protein product [Medioppia subpectinata]
MIFDVRFSYSLSLILVAIAISEAAHKPSPHRFSCPPKKVPGGIKEIMTCATKFKFMLDQICKPKYGIKSDLIMNLAKHVFFHAIKCIDEDYEHFLIDGALECFIADGSPGTKMMCNVKASVCNPSMQGEMAACAMKEAKMHTIDMAKLMSMAGHLGWKS